MLRLYPAFCAVFSGAAAVLAALGHLELFACIVGRRTNEIAVRVRWALSAPASSPMVIGEGLRLSLVGIGVVFIQLSPFASK
jgi:hypothetical protein